MSTKSKPAHKDIQQAVANMLPNYWNLALRGGVPVVTECDCPTFALYATGAEWVKPMETMWQEIVDCDKGDTEIADVWKAEAVTLFDKITEIYQQA